MEKSKKYYELQALDLWDFPALIRKAREIQGITLEALCKDLCSFSMIGKIERGERLASKELRDRILARLGVCSDGYENFLFYEDYLVWKKRQRIVNAIEKSDFATAEKLLTSYDKKGDGNRLEKQFCLVMKAQIMQKRHEDRAEIAKLYENAVKLTVSDVDYVSVKELCLSVQELDMILEYERCCRPDRLASRCEEILEYINSDVFDTYSYVKIYPKVIFYLYTSTAEKDRDWNRILKLCNVGIEQLRTAGRMYYFWELLEIKKEILMRFMDYIENDEDGRKHQALQKVIDKTADWLKALDFVHDLCGTQRKMDTSCYLYQQKEAYCISDVIRRRREMLGLTKKDLCKDICSEKTIGRLEAKKTKPQIEIVRQLFERLNLSGEYQRWQIVTQDVRAFSIADEIVRCVNNRDSKGAEKYLFELEQYISAENPINMQYQKRVEANLMFERGNYTKEAVREQFKGILEYTIPYEAAIRKGEKYLTNVEIQCLLNMAVYTEGPGINVVFDALIDLCSQLERDEGISEHIAVWEIIMTDLTSVYGNIGEYDKSDEISKMVMKEGIYCYRMKLLELNLYNNVWNNLERLKKDIPLSKGYQSEEYLKKCISLCQINKNIGMEKRINQKCRLK